MILNKNECKKQPLVSVLITNYNYNHYLRAAIDSALNQTYSHREVIVVDDGSTDNSREVIASYKDKIISVFKENGGQASAINAGFTISQGEIICFLDADDVWLPTKVEQVVQSACAYPNAVVIYHKVQNIDGTGQLTGKPWPPYKVIMGDIFSQVLKTGGWWPCPPSTALSFTRTFLMKVMNIPEEDYRFSAEPYLTDLAPFLGEIVGINQALSLFRLHGATNWSNPTDLDKRQLQNYEVRTEILNQKLINLGINVKVNLADHWPYQHLRYQLGYEKNLIYLSRLVFQDPWQSRLVSKLHMLLKIGMYKC